MNNKKIIYSLSVWFFISFIFLPSNAEKQSYNLTVDENNFVINYELNGYVIAMAIDKELKSLLVGTENVKDSIFTITLPNEVISAENNSFVILVNGFEVDYSITPKDENSVISFPIEYGTEEIEIIGTYVIPEFPLGFMLILISLISIIVILNLRKNLLSY